MLTSQQRSIIVVTWVTTFLSFFILLFRIIVRLRHAYLQRRHAGSRGKTPGRNPSEWYGDDVWSLVAIFVVLARLPIIHMSLVHGNNNVKNPEKLEAGEVRRRELGMKLLIVSRLLLVTYFWIMKMCIAIFYRRLTKLRKTYDIAAKSLIALVAATYIFTITIMLTECQPFRKNWQVVPSPGPHCVQVLRQVYIQGIVDIFTNIVIIIFPLPIVLVSKLPTSKKIELIVLFSLGVIVVIVTLVRLPIVINNGGNLQFTRTMWTSIEVLACTIIPCAPIIKAFFHTLPGKINSTSRGTGGSSETPQHNSAARPIDRSRDSSAIRMHSFSVRGRGRRNSPDTDSDEEVLTGGGSSGGNESRVTVNEDGSIGSEAPCTVSKSN